MPWRPDVGVMFTLIPCTARILSASEKEGERSAFVTAVMPRYPIVALYPIAIWQVIEVGEVTCN